MSETLLHLQEIQIEILDVIDGICRENDIHYSLYGGTLLGAVRHQGFIPWDDDLDVCMPREDYNKFIELWNEIEPEGYILQNKNSDPRFTQSFTKIRKNHTTFLQNNDVKRGYHTGIFVDVFPVDRMPTNPISRAIFKWKCTKYHLYMREFIPPKGNKIVKIVSGSILKVTSVKRRANERKKFEGKIRKVDLNTKLPVVFIDTVDSLRTLYPADILNEYVELKFGPKKYMCFAQYDLILRLKYNDYMKLPPEEERDWKHKPLVVDFEHNYNEM